MKKKLITIISVLLAAVFGLGIFAGCDLITVDNKRDMEQVVAEVNIGSDQTALENMFDTLFGDYTLSTDVTDKLSEIVTTENIYKRDLVAYFINYGYSYVSSGSYTYAQVFEMLMDSLVSRKILLQYAMLYYLSEGEIVVDRDSLSPDVLENLEDYGYEIVYDKNGQETDGIRVKSGLSVDGFLEAKNADGAEGDAQVLQMIRYFLTEDERKYAEYQLRLAINNSIDTYEEEIIALESGDSSSDSSSDRTVPTGANETDANYYPKTESGELDYQIYTGSNYTEDLGEYEKLDGSTPVTRRRAYNSFINALSRNYLKDESESPADITALEYYAVELKAQYEQVMIDKFADTLALNMSALQEESDMARRYNLLYDTQRATASNGTSSDFTTTMDSMSDSSFVLYSPSAGYGFVQNVLLPFNARQTAYLTAFRNSNTTAAYYAERNRMAQYILGSDQRSSWFNGSEDYSFDADEAGVDYYGKEDGTALSKYLFFKDSYTGGGDGIDRYAGKYPYHGSVSDEDGDGVYELIPEKITIDDFLNELDGYLGFIDEDLSLEERSRDGAFYTRTASDFVLNVSSTEGTEYDFSKTIYYKGSVAGLGDVTPSSLLAADSASYNAISVFNDLMFAYSTDTGCLNTYLGYSIAAEGYSTSYVEEFQYAAQEAVAAGTGTVYVVLTDYGWHIVYVSLQLPAEEVYAGGFDYDARNDEGTFSYYFYQALKDEVSSSYTSEMQNRVIDLLNNDSNVTIYESRYSDLSSLG